MKNALPPVATELSVSESDRHDAPGLFPGTKNRRQLRVIYALLRGPCTRTEVDAIAGASNGPEVIAQLRERRLTIPCVRIPSVDRDGIAVRSGQYRLTAADRHKILAWLNTAGCQHTLSDGRNND
jgi:hypothetical protein